MNPNPQSIRIDEFDYPLPAERIADNPLEARDQSRLLVYKDGFINDDQIKNLYNHLNSNDNLILNNTRVIEARIHFKKDTGGTIEIFCLEPESFKDPQLAMAQKKQVLWNCMIGGASKWKPGQILKKEISINSRNLILSARYLSKKEDSFLIEFSWSADESFAEVLHAAGAIPLPPYIKRQPEESDAERYQTIFAQYAGSVAAPTAALHFTERVFRDLAKKGLTENYITLHVGAGTFKPVKTPTIGEHQMHAESFSISIQTLQALGHATEIIAVGTTSLRTLESIHWLGVKILTQEIKPELYLDQWEAYELDQRITYRESIQALINYCHQTGASGLFCRTSLIIVPGYTFRSAKALITNFHQPKSTLLLLVAAFIGADWKKVYDHALKHKYRFLSYGDSSLLWRRS
jgi:S-adenosylmethionine:tRNA ribosyltransferase-isomerase